jgi:hypothetical protein
VYGCQWFGFSVVAKPGTAGQQQQKKQQQQQNPQMLAGAVHLLCTVCHSM